MTSKERHEMRYQRRQAERNAKKARLFRCNDYEWIFRYDHLYDAYRQCRKDVRWKASVQRFIGEDVMRLYILWKDLTVRKYRMKPMYSFELVERGKARHIQSVRIRDRVVQRCFCDHSLVPLLSRSFIYDNSACLTGKGYHFAIQRLTEHLRRHVRKHGNSGYILLFDFKKYFESIPHETARSILRKVITDPDLFQIAEQVLDGFESNGSGLGLGSQISQILALAVSDRLDHYIKDQCGIKGYGRYNDDGYIIHPDKEYLKRLIVRIREICAEAGVELNEKKTQIVRISHGFTWLKARFTITETGRILRRLSRQSIVRERLKLKKLKRLVTEGKITRKDVYQGFQSWRAYALNFSAWNSIQRMTKLYEKLYVYDREEEFT